MSKIIYKTSGMRERPTVYIPQSNFHISYVNME